MYVIRNQGFFYTDEYYAPGDVFKRVSKKVYETKAEADKACAKLIREWIRSEPLGNYVFDDGVVIDNVTKYLKKQFPDDVGDWDSELMIPESATDKQVDHVVKLMEVTFAQVFEVGDDDDDVSEDEEPSEDDEDEDDEDDEDEHSFDDDLHYGPR